MARKKHGRSDRIIAASLTLRHAQNCEAGARPVTAIVIASDANQMQHGAEKTGVAGLKVSVE